MALTDEELLAFYEERARSFDRAKTKRVLSVCARATIFREAGSTERQRPTERLGGFPRPTAAFR